MLTVDIRIQHVFKRDKMANMLSQHESITQWGRWPLGGSTELQPACVTMCSCYSPGKVSQIGDASRT
jgi:hypothetical protein